MAKILIVEDHEATRRTLVKRLSKAGHEVEGADSGIFGLELLKVTDFDLVVLDFMMKKMNGMQTFEQMKILKPSIPYVMLTAYAHEGMIKQFMNEGGADFIVKPFKEDLEIRIEKALGASDN